ncbi:MAG: hypothetical protein LIO44_01450 [Eubacterium sp.]|nr:hypothetical protein [Eubacterium sp.]
MKNKFYYKLMLSLCCGGIVSCLAILFLCREISVIFKAVVFILNIAYIFGAAHYKRKYNDCIRFRREYEKLKKKQSRYYPENSYYLFIRRSV